MSSLLLAVVNILIYLRHPYFCTRFRRRVGYFPNVANPARYNEKFFWRKMFDRNPVFAVCSDKLACKDLFRSKTPDLPIAEVVWTGKTFDREAFGLFTDDTVLKANHGCNMNLVPDGRPRSFEELQRLTRRWMRRDHHRRNLEYAYRDIERTLFLEERLREPGRELVEIQVRAANGKSILLSATVGQKTANAQMAYFDLDGKRVRELDPDEPDERLPDAYELPASYRDAIRSVEILGKDIDYARYDFFCLGDRLYGGEITIYPAAGLGRSDEHKKASLDSLVARNWDIRTSHFFKTRGNWLTELYKSLLLKELNRRAESGRAA